MSIKTNTLWNVFGSISPMFIGLISLPYILRSIGVEKLGILTLIWALIGYFSVFDFGLGRALTQKISKINSIHNDDKHFAKVATAGLRLVFITGLGGATIIIVVVSTLGIQWLNVSESLLRDVNWSILIASIAIPVTTVTSGLKGILEGVELFRVVNIYKLILGTANFISPVISIVLFGPSLTLIVFFLVFSRIVVMLLHARSVMKIITFKGYSKEQIDKNDSKELLVFGSWMTLSNLLSPLMSIGDRFVLSSILGAGMVAYYTIPSEFLIRLLIIPAALTTTLFPILTRKISTDINGARDLYHRANEMIFLIMFPALLILSLGAHLGLSIWLGKVFADQSYIVVTILAVGIFFCSLAQTPHAAIQAAGNARLTSLIHVGEFVFYAPLLFFLIKYVGISGAALAWACRAIADFLVLNYFARKILGINKLRAHPHLI